ncbi:conserved hypothetical protein [Mesotoga infera]|nr:conserved hypothetical protein [Mesotoga infera]
MAWIILSRCKPPPMSVQGGFWKKGSCFIRRHTQELRLLVVSEVSMDMSVFQRVPLPDTRLFILIPVPLVLLRRVIAIENIAVGVLFAGGISFGLFSFGGLAFSILLPLGGVSSSLIFTLGGLAFSLYFAAGGLVASYDLALGGMAIARNYATEAFQWQMLPLGKTPEELHLLADRDW